ncbi:MAG: AMP-binding protein [Deltaproteobacteria bacterium]|nr:AMP-binding protein [Deltaproteobacteria bacterium]
MTQRPYLVQHFLEESARRLPSKTALICGSRRFTYCEINDTTDRLACFLASTGVQRQDRVAVWLDNSAEAVFSIFGILKADAVFLVLSPTMKAGKLAFILNDCQVKTLITHVNRSRMALEAAAAAEHLENIVWVGEKDEVPSGQTERIAHASFAEALLSQSPGGKSHTFVNIDQDLAAIIYTSGSTGEPKGIMLTHLNMLSAAHSITTYLENREDDIIINALPLSFDYGLYQVLMAFKFGGTVVLEWSFTYPYQVIQRMIDERVTGFPGVPTIFAILLGLKGLEKYDFSHLRYITNTAAALPPAHIRKLRELFPHVRIYSMYGLTECKRVSYLPPEEIDRRPNSIGRGMPNEEVWIVDENGDRIPPGTVGELVVRGSNVMRGYWNRPEDTARTLRPGRYPGEVVLHTGDLFRMDDEGYLYFVGRRDDMIKTRGERVSPREIEACLFALDGVAEAAVIGVPHEILGQAIVAFVRCGDGVVLTARDVLRHCKRHLEEFMIPQSVELVSSFPKTSTGKIDKLSLRSFQAARQESCSERTP